jgi:hypothetical protein
MPGKVIVEKRYVSNAPQKKNQHLILHLKKAQKMKHLKKIAKIYKKCGSLGNCEKMLGVFFGGVNLEIFGQAPCFVLDLVLISTLKVFFLDGTIKE